ncbi:MAG: hypothetical protein KAJ19_11765 [Gammaproteobacteria bacterium]|nr:hypothetical protein [Gammaproteobacteria bacterium]
MHGKISNWNMQTITQPAQDVGFGTRILSAGTKTRFVSSLSSHSGTNTANNVVTKYFLLPSQPPASPSTNTYDSTSQIGAVAFLQTQNMGTTTTAVASAGLISDRGGAFGFFVPPGFILVSYITDVNSDGTIIHSVISGECEY